MWVIESTGCSEVGEVSEKRLEVQYTLLAVVSGQLAVWLGNILDISHTY